MPQFKREILVYESHFWDFYNTLDEAVQKKLDWTITLIERTRLVPVKYLKHITNTEGLWEVRVRAGNGIFRVFCFFDEGEMIILLGGFQKKSQKTPKREIRKATKLKQKYYDEK